MESMLSFVTKFKDVLKNHIRETTECLGKDVVDSTASRTGICVDKIKIAYGAKFSMLGHNYKESESNQIERFDEDVLVCQGVKGLFFVPVSGVKALGGSVILVDTNLNQPENGSMNKRKQEVFRKFYNTKKAIRQVIPKIEEPKTRNKKKKRRLKIFY